MGVQEYLANMNKKKLRFYIIKKGWSHVCPCMELPGWKSLGEILSDADGILHAGREQFIENVEVHWSDLCEHFWKQYWSKDTFTKYSYIKHTYYTVPRLF